MRKTELTKKEQLCIPSAPVLTELNIRSEAAPAQPVHTRARLTSHAGQHVILTSHAAAGALILNAV